MQKSVKEELVSDVPVGVWLSGGLDSSTVLHYAAEASPNRIHTFSVTFQGRSFDESQYIREVSHHFGTNHTEFDLNTDAELADTILQIATYSDEPSADAGAVPLWFLAKMTAQDVTVILTGEGGDELFAGYLTYKANRYSDIARKFPAAMLRAGLAAANHLPVSDDKISFEYKVKRFLQGSLMTPEKAHVFWNGTFTDEEKEQLFRYADSDPLAGVLQDLRPGRGLGRFLEFDQRYYLADDILYKVDRISMAHSLEVRPPFLDDRIVDFANRLPDNYKLRGSQSKYVLRRLMENKLPQSVLRRPKIGFDIPIHEWFRGVLRPLLLETLSEEAITSSQLFSWPYVRHLLDEHLERKANLGYHLWGLLVLFIWMKRWNIETAVEESEAAKPLARGSWRGWIVVVAASLVFLVGVISPPRLVDDVDAVQAQIARNMLSSGDWVTARLDGVRLPRKISAHILDDSGFLPYLWSARLGSAPAACVVLHLALLGCLPFWALGLW